MEKIRKFLSVERVVCLLACCFLLIGLIDLIRLEKWLDFSVLLTVLILFLITEFILW